MFDLPSPVARAKLSRIRCQGRAQLFLHDLWAEHFGLRTIDSFRPRVSNTLQIAKEMLVQLESTEHGGGQGRQHLYDIAAEGHLLATYDPVLPLIDMNTRTLVSSFFDCARSDRTSWRLFDMREILQQIIPKLTTAYNSVLPDYLSRLVDSDADLSQISRCFYALATQWLANGFTTLYLREQISERSSTSASGGETLISLLRRVSGTTTRPPTYLCHVTVTIDPNQDEDLWRALSKAHLFEITTPPEKFKQRNLRSSIEGPDPYAAMAEFRRRVANLFDHMVFVKPSLRLRIPRRVTAIEKSSGRKFNPSKPLPFVEPRHAGHLPKPASHASLLQSAIQNSSARAREQVHGALRQHRLALRADTVDSRFMALWVGLESLIRQSGRSVMRSLLNSVPYIMALRNIRKYIMYFHDRLLRLTMQRAGDLSISEAHSQWIELLDLFRADDEDLAKMIEALQNYPVFGHRLDRFARSVKNNEAIHRFITNNKRNVAWQMKRLFRARNSLVHSGKTPTPGFYLTRILHDYLYVTVKHTGRALQRASSETSVEQVLIRTQISYDSLVSKLKSRAGHPVDSEDLVFPVYYDNVPER